MWRGPFGTAIGAPDVELAFAVVVMLGYAAAAFGQTARPASVAAAVEDERSIVFELGAAGDWSRTEGFHPGATVAFEVTPIERWLEIEAGVSAIRTDGGAELPFDVLFKKPWQVSRGFEFMLGAGPELVRDTGRARGTSWGLEAVADLMFWPRARVGWYVEPGYEMTRRGGASHHGAGISGGVLLAR